MGAAIEIDVQKLKKLARKLNSYALSDSDKTRLMQSLALMVKEQTKTRFDTGRDPQGDPWRKLTEAYKKRKALTSSGGILVASGLMQTSIESQLIDNDNILVGSPMEYAGYHQNTKSENRKRVFLGLGTDDISELQDAVDTFMERHVA